jgi:hypothetical protein
MLQIKMLDLEQHSISTLAGGSSDSAQDGA